MHKAQGNDRTRTPTKTYGGARLTNRPRYHTPESHQPTSLRHQISPNQSFQHHITCRLLAEAIDSSALACLTDSVCITIYATYGAVQPGINQGALILVSPSSFGRQGVWNSAALAWRARSTSAPEHPIYGSPPPLRHTETY